MSKRHVLHLIRSCNAHTIVNSQWRISHDSHKIRARIENRIQVQFYHNQIEHAEKRYLSSLSLQRWTKTSAKFTLHRLMKLYGQLLHNILRNLFTNNSSRQYFSIIKFRGTKQTWQWQMQQLSHAFAPPQAKSRGAPERPVWEPLL